VRTPTIAFITGLTAAIVAIWAGIHEHFTIAFLALPVLIVSIVAGIAWVFKGWAQLVRPLSKNADAQREPRDRP
jgi:hypothetical protein